MPRSETFATHLQMLGKVAWAKCEAPEVVAGPFSKAVEDMRKTLQPHIYGYLGEKTHNACDPRNLPSLKFQFAGERFIAAFPFNAIKTYVEKTEEVDRISYSYIQQFLETKMSHTFVADCIADKMPFYHGVVSPGTVLFMPASFMICECTGKMTNFGIRASTSSFFRHTRMTEDMGAFAEMLSKGIAKDTMEAYLATAWHAQFVKLGEAEKSEEAKDKKENADGEGTKVDDAAGELQKADGGDNGGQKEMPEDDGKANLEGVSTAAGASASATASDSLTTSIAADADSKNQPPPACAKSASSSVPVPVPVPGGLFSGTGKPAAVKAGQLKPKPPKAAPKRSPESAGR